MRRVGKLILADLFSDIYINRFMFKINFTTKRKLD